MVSDLDADLRTMIDVTKLATTYDQEYRGLPLHARTTAYLDASLHHFGDLFYTFAGDPLGFLQGMHTAGLPQTDIALIATTCCSALKKGMSVTIEWLSDDGASQRAYDCIILRTHNVSAWVVHPAPWSNATRWNAEEVVIFDPVRDSWHIPQTFFVNF